MGHNPIPPPRPIPTYESWARDHGPRPRKPATPTYRGGPLEPADFLRPARLLMELSLACAGVILMLLGLTGHVGYLVAGAVALGVPAALRMGLTPVPKIPLDRRDPQERMLDRVREGYAADLLTDDELDESLEWVLGGGRVDPDGRVVGDSCELRSTKGPVGVLTYPAGAMTTNDRQVFAEHFARQIMTVPIVDLGSYPTVILTGYPEPGGLPPARPAPPDPGKRSTR